MWVKGAQEGCKDCSWQTCHLEVQKREQQHLSVTWGPSREILWCFLPVAQRLLLSSRVRPQISGLYKIEMFFCTPSQCWSVLWPLASWQLLSSQHPLWPGGWMGSCGNSVLFRNSVSEETGLEEWWLGFWIWGTLITCWGTVESDTYKPLDKYLPSQEHSQNIGGGHCCGIVA